VAVIVVRAHKQYIGRRPDSIQGYRVTERRYFNALRYNARLGAAEDGDEEAVPCPCGRRQHKAVAGIDRGRGRRSPASIVATTSAPGQSPEVSVGARNAVTCSEFSSGSSEHVA